MCSVAVFFSVITKALAQTSPRGVLRRSVSGRGIIIAVSGIASQYRRVRLEL